MAKIMIVEDEERYMAQIAGIVERAGHEPICFDGHRQALDAYDAERPHMVIADYSGPSACQALMAEIRWKDGDIPVYVQSHGTPSEYMLKEDRVTGFIPKRKLDERLPAILAEHFGGSE